MGGLFKIVEDSIIRHREFFHWKYSGVLLPFFFGTGVSVALANQFALAYLFFVLFGVWTICYWLSSNWLQKKKRSFNNRQTKKNQLLFKGKRRTYQIWKWGLCSLFGLLTLVSLGLVRRAQIDYELSLFHGWLIPAQDSFPPNDCSKVIPDAAVRVYIGGRALAFTERFPFSVVTVKGESKIKVEKNENGDIAISLDVFDEQDNIVASIVRNQFQVNPYNTFKMSREDASSLNVTIPKRKENVLKLKYLNSRAIKIVGTFRYPGIPLIVFGEDGVKVGSSLYQDWCLGNVDGAFRFD